MTPSEAITPAVTPAARGLDRHGTCSHEVYTAGFYPTDQDSAVRSLLGQASRGGADAGEVLATIAGIGPGDEAGWITAWTALGTRVAEIASGCAQRGHHVSAARAHLRATNYLAVAVKACMNTDRDRDMLALFRLQAAAWDGFMATTSWPVERVDIPYEGASMPGWLFHPGSSATLRPVLVAVNGSDGALSGLWTGYAEGALERGYAVLLFDGPGQQSMYFERCVPFRADWENVLTPVVDFLLDRDDVDPGRLAVSGVSQAGQWVPRALAFEHRFAAAIVDGGAVDVSRAWFDRLPPDLHTLYDQGRRAEFDEAMESMLAAPEAADARRVWRGRGRPYGASGYYDLLEAVSRHRSVDLVGRITTPLCIADPDGEQFFAGQPAELAALVPGATLTRFTQEEGASHHCQPMARELTEQRLFDWLDEHLHRSDRSIGGAAPDRRAPDAHETRRHDPDR